MEILQLNTAVYNNETEKIIKDEEIVNDVQSKLDDGIISEFDKQNKADDSILDETPADVENDNMKFLLNAA